MICLPKFSCQFNFKAFERCLNISFKFLLNRKSYSTKIPPFLSQLFTNKINLELLEYPELSSENELFNAISWSDKFSDVTSNIDKSCTDTNSITKILGSHGLLSLIVPKNLGGIELNKMQFMQIVEMMHFNLPVSLSTLLQHYLITEAFNLSNSEMLKMKYLSKLATGEMQGIFCIDEEFSNELVPRNFKTHATLSADGTFYRINGLKQNILNIDPSKMLLVIANVNRENKGNVPKPAAFIIDPNSRGIVFIPKPESHFNLPAIKSFDVSFSDVVVPVENILIDEVSVPELTNKLATFEYNMLSGIHLGLLKTIFPSYFDFVSNREIFGVALLDYQRLRFDLTSLSKDIYINESLVYFIAGMMDHYPSDDFIMESAATKVYSSNSLSKWNNKLIALLGHTGLHKKNNYYVYSDECKYLEYHRISSVNIRAILGKMIVRYLLDQDYYIRNDWFTEFFVSKALISTVHFTDIHGNKRGHPLDYIHPTLYMLISILNDELRNVNVKLLSLKVNHGNLLLQDSLLHYKLSEIILDLWMVFINVCRTTRGQCLNFPTSRHQLYLWVSESQKIESKMKREFTSLLNYLKSYDSNKNSSLSTPEELKLSICHPFDI